MPTPNTGIPYVPEGTLDPAAGLNLSLNVIDALLQTAVIDMDQTSPPVSPSDGDLHIVSAGATGEWLGQENNMARYVAEGSFWQFLEAGTQVRLVVNNDDAGLYFWNVSAWSPISASGVVWGSVTGTLSDQTDLQSALDAKATIGLIPQNIKSADYTLVLSDSGKHILHPSSDTTGRTFTIPANSSVAFPIGTAVTFVNQNSAGAITISIATDTMRLAGPGTTGNRSLTANGIATALKITSTEWIISGTGLT